MDEKLLQDEGNEFSSFYAFVVEVFNHVPLDTKKDTVLKKAGHLQTCSILNRK
jgi:hypothetical protein